jgi:hypothetical protein
MALSILFIALSLALFAYWFRYSCLLILRTRTAEDFASDVARANGLSFEAVRGQIEAGDLSNSKELYAILERDYRIVTRLMDQMDSPAKEEGMMEINLLHLHFHVSRLCFQASQALGLKGAANALEEMADTVSHFANSVGEWKTATASV